MALATQDTGRSRARLAALPGPGHLSTRIEIVENPITGHDARLGAEVEEAVERALHDENLGLVQVRFRVCQDESDGLRFICKVENPPRVEGDGNPPPWRWWSPLLETAEGFRESLEEGLTIRRQRLAMVTTRG
ncbi:MAG: hypothetical protein DMF77_26170 [Acidobacteria bacterium]|nr:MAG: hypothetical protein DMF77_26170 [Acidobacteriota bacterium]